MTPFFANCADSFSALHRWLFETLIQPILFYTGWTEISEAAFDGTEWFLIGVIEMLLLWAILRPLETWLAVERADAHSAQMRYDARRTDFLYTALHRLGGFSLLIFFLLEPVLDQLRAVLHQWGWNPINLDSIWPFLSEHPIWAFFVYLFILDGVDYFYHRASHQFRWWWALHSLHHSQQYMNLWSDNRNHLLDDLLRDLIMAAVALMIGVQPAQYIVLVAATRIMQSVQHANIRIHFGWLGERLLVSPRYHRLHHAIGVGHESHGKGTLGGHNFAVLFPIWDILFGTAHFGKTFAATGIRNQLPPPEGQSVDYGHGFWQQQQRGLARLFSVIRTYVKKSL